MRVLITGMSGTGKTTVLAELAGRGFPVVDTDSDEWSHWVVQPDGSRDWVWRADAIGELLAAFQGRDLFVAGCKSNQGDFYDSFEHVVLFTAPVHVMLERIARRTDNPYGKSPAEREEILRNVDEVQPLLRNGVTVEIETTVPAWEVADDLVRLVRLAPSADGVAQP